MEGLENRCDQDALYENFDESILKNVELQSLAPYDTSTAQLFHLRLRDNCGIGTRKNVKQRRTRN